MTENYVVLKQGTWLYGGEVVCGVRIVKCDTLLGEDDAGALEEVPGEFYCFQFSSVNERCDFRGLGPCFLTLADALSQADVLTSGTVTWI